MKEQARIIPFQQISYDKAFTNKKGDLSVAEQHLLDILVSKVNIKDPFHAVSSFSVSEIAQYSNKSLQTVKNNIKALASKELTIFRRDFYPDSMIYDTLEKDKTYYPIKIKIFSLFEKNDDDIFNYKFSSDFISYLSITKKSSEFSYIIDLNTSEMITSKTALILFYIWSANKDNNADLRICTTYNVWRKLLGMENRSDASVVSNIQNGIKNLRKLFGDRYYFSTVSFRSNTQKGYGIHIFGDNSTSYPILNENTDTGIKKTDIHFLQDNNYSKNVSRIIDNNKFEYPIITF